MISPNSIFKDVILTVTAALQKEFQYKIASFFFGDPVTYPPNVFISPHDGTYQPVIAISPSYNHMIDGEQWMNGEMRLFGLDILVLVNYTSQIEALPTQKIGEESLMDATDEIFEFLRRYPMLTLHDSVKFANVGDINWTWVPRQNQPLRGAVISYEVKVAIQYDN